MRRQLDGSRAIVTGASSGIGWEISRELARRGVRLVITGRRQERLSELATAITAMGGSAITVAGDITDSDVRQRLVETASQKLGGLDVLINNAGVGAEGPFLDASPERLRFVFETNFFAPVELIRGCLPLLRDGRSPMVVNVGSVLGHRAVPNKSEYCASKFALHGFSDALRAELLAEGIDVLLVSPSTTESEFFDHVVQSQPGLVKRRRGIPANRVARQAIWAMERGKHELILPVSGKLLVWLDRLFPRLADSLIARFG